MIRDARDISAGASLPFDLVIVGAGAAGITLAREFAGRSIRVCLLESGALAFDNATQSLYKGLSTGLPYYALETCRLRYFGGTTNHWAGYCRPLEDMDFEKRAWVPYSGWPIRKSDLNPYYERACQICGLGEDPTFDARGLQERFPLFAFPADRVRTTIFRISRTRFGETYRQEVHAATNVIALLNANVVEIQTDRAARSVTGLQVSTLEGKRFSVTGKAVVLAAGGIENARLLLLSNRMQRNGLGNRYDLVGRFFADHPMIDVGWLMPTDPLGPLGLPVYHPAENATLFSGAFALSAEAQEEHGILNHCFLLHPEDYPPSGIDGVESLRAIAGQLRQGEFPDDLAGHIGNILRDADASLPLLYRRLRGGAPLCSHIGLQVQSECVPNPESRVTLSRERDPLGLPRVQLDWRLSEFDKRSMRQALEIAGREIGRLGLGRVRNLLDTEAGWPMPTATWPWTGPRGASHHMGTTRMSDDPSQGVVDADCKVHGVANLFLAGSSVFPTFGYANPTLTIVALSLRLAEHLRGLLRS